MKKKISYKIFYVFMGLIFALILLITSLINALTPVKTFSEKENRVLSSKPTFTFSSVVSGKYEEDYEAYTNDQFLFRNSFVTLKAGVDRLLGKVEENGVYLGRKSYLMEGFTDPSAETESATLTSIETFAKNHTDIPQYALIAPTAVSTLKKYVPANAPIDDQDDYLDDLSEFFNLYGITFIDTRSTLQSHSDEMIYYHTDHHWTTQGAYYAFETLGKALSLDTEKYTYKVAPVSYHFQGTLSAKTGFLSGKEEELDVFLPEDESTMPQFVINLVEEQTKSASFYDSTKLDGRDKYSVFFGGNHAEVKITSTVANDKTLLVLKDSYANCLVPFLAPYYEKILMIDPRYYYGDLENLIATEDVNQILYLYNANTFSGDTSLSLVLDGE